MNCALFIVNCALFIVNCGMPTTILLPFIIQNDACFSEENDYKFQ